MNFNKSNILHHYRSGKHTLSKDFFIPCLKASIKYRRAVGYFSTTTLLEWVEIIDEILKNELKIELIISPNLTEIELEKLRNLQGTDKTSILEKYAFSYLNDLDDFFNRGELDKWRVELFAWLIVNEILHLKFAVPEGEDVSDLFHDKIGIFDIDENTVIAFLGSANETKGGYKRNHESIDVYRSWIEGDKERVQTKVEQFAEAWENEAVGLNVFSLSQKALDLVKTYAPSTPNRPKKPVFKSQKKLMAETLWDHQKEAFDKFLEAKNGVLEMATGTGKTRTAIAIMEDLFVQNQIDATIITVEGTDLLKQWREEIDEWGYRNDKKVYSQFEGEHELSKFIRNPHNSILVLSRHQLGKLFLRTNQLSKHNVLIIHDEVHGFGSPSHVQKLKGTHVIFKYRLGLSATPDREYDAEGNAFIEDEIGPIIFSFDLSDAIKSRILCPLDYQEIEYDLSANDMQRLQGIFAKYRKKDELNEPYLDTDKYRDIALVYKTSENKVHAFKEFIENHPGALQSSILFFATTAYAQKFLPIIHDKTIKYRTYFADDDQKHLVEFAKGNIDCLVTCHKISQGIDIPSLSSVILVSSDRARLETIQRIGRCLRKDITAPEKIARVYDFIGYKEGAIIDADAYRSEWLTELSNSRP